MPARALRPGDTRETVKGGSSLTDVRILTIIFSKLGLEAEDGLLDDKSVGEVLDVVDREHAFDP